jgi:hypothetical protein
MTLTRLRGSLIIDIRGLVTLHHSRFRPSEDQQAPLCLPLARNNQEAEIADPCFARPRCIFKLPFLTITGLRWQ